MMQGYRKGNGYRLPDPFRVALVTATPAGALSLSTIPRDSSDAPASDAEAVPTASPGAGTSVCRPLVLIDMLDCVAARPNSCFLCAAVVALCFPPPWGRCGRNGLIGALSEMNMEVSDVIGSIRCAVRKTTISDTVTAMTPMKHR
eukprot:NODE_4640_length_782_cov_8.525239_g4296_i0.p2 GENE.NODE_4640_length_782_cov_8.525239_g4296_i0~~NODE_4640_length_782_cov_8.525239_g4296_i0.p2  ORF type:complete len:145 (-),score=0.67 NODE_4640_length_782_cov_8.525239_g4296_i0:173-607(-)